jgi:hypothetical protein
MLRDIPVWFKICAVICLVVGIASFAYTFNKCGAKTFLLGNGGLYAAASGMCD